MKGIFRYSLHVERSKTQWRKLFSACMCPAAHQFEIPTSVLVSELVYFPLVTVF